MRKAVCLLGGFPALAGADLDADAGDVVLLAGPNGAGKTTLLRLCAGLVPLRSGSATVLGHDLARDRRGVRRRIAYVGHQTFCYDDLTVAENLRFATRAVGRDLEAVDDVIERVGLGSQRDVAHGRLSQGQRRRLSLGIALARDAELLLLDEPHAGLDAGGRAVVDDFVRAAREGGRTVLLASHELDLARTVATREVVVVGGQVTGGRLDAGDEQPPAPPVPAGVLAPSSAADAERAP